MTLEFNVSFKQLLTVMTVMWSYVAVYMTFMSLQVAGSTETLLTQCTSVYNFVSVHGVQFHVNF